MGFLIWAAISGYSEKIWSNMFTGYQRSTFLLNKKQCTNDWVNTRKSLKYKGFRSIGDTERVCMVSYIIYIYFFTHVTPYSATLAYVRTPLKNRKYITCKYISIYVGEWGCF